MKHRFIEGDGAIVAKEHPEGVDVAVSQAAGGVLSLDAAERLARHILALVKAKRPKPPPVFTTWHQLPTSPGRVVEHWAIHDAAGNLLAETWQAGPECWTWMRLRPGGGIAGTASTRDAAMSAALPEVQEPGRVAGPWTAYQYAGFGVEGATVYHRRVVRGPSRGLRADIAALVARDSNTGMWMVRSVDGAAIAMPFDTLDRAQLAADSHLRSEGWAFVESMDTLPTETAP